MRVAAQEQGEAGESLFQVGGLGRRGPLLRPVDGGCSVGAEQRAGHVGQQRDAARGCRAKVPEVRVPGVGQVAAAIGQSAAVGVAEAQPEGGQQAGSAVRGGGPAQADDQPGRPVVQGGGDGLTGTTGGGAERVGPGHQRQATGRGQLHDGRAVREQGVAAGGGPPVRARAVGHVVQDRARRGGEDGGEGALAAVGERDQTQVVPWPDPAPALRQRFGDGDGVKGALEGVGRDDDLHRPAT